MKFNSSSYKIVKEKRFRMFLLSLLIAIIAWSIINLSKEYNKTIEVVLRVVNIPNETIIKNQNTMLEVEVSGTGFSLLNSKLEGLVHEVDMNVFPENWRWNNNEGQFKSIISEQLKIKSVVPDRVQFNKIRLSDKKVRVFPAINIQTQTGFGVSDMSITPEEVIIYGDESILKEVDSVFTERISFLDVKDSVNGKLALRNDFNLKYSKDSILYAYNIERYTQGEFTIPILIKNAPINKEITIFPKQVTVQFQSPLSKFSSIKGSQFQAYVDANNLVGNKLLKIELENYPGEVINVRLLKNSVTYLLIDK